jgi:hypothetical protein
MLKAAASKKTFSPIEISNASIKRERCQYNRIENNILGVIAILRQLCRFQTATSSKIPN